MELTSRVRSATADVSVGQSVDLSKLGRCIGTAPSKSRTPNLNFEHRWEIPVENLPAFVQEELRRNPFTRCKSVIYVDLPRGNTFVTDFALLDYARGGRIDPNLLAFLKRGTDVVNAQERQWLVQQLTRVDPSLAAKVAAGESIRKLLGLDAGSECPASPAPAKPPTIDKGCQVASPTFGGAKPGSTVQMYLAQVPGEARGIGA
jgi:hypothetical protein